MNLSFSYRKTTQAFTYFAQQAGGQINKMKALKLIYFADRYHLRTYGRPITNDTYFAMKFGPVASACRNLLSNEEAKDAETTYVDEHLRVVGQYDYSCIKNMDEKVFSSSDREALAFAWEHYAALDQFSLAEETHRFPEWKKHEAALTSEHTSRRHMPYTDFLQNPDKGVDPSSPLDEETRELRTEELQELQAIESIWS